MTKFKMSLLAAFLVMASGCAHRGLEDVMAGKNMSREAINDLIKLVEKNDEPAATKVINEVGQFNSTERAWLVLAAVEPSVPCRANLLRIILAKKGEPMEDSAVAKALFEAGRGSCAVAFSDLSKISSKNAFAAAMNGRKGYQSAENDPKVESFLNWFYAWDISRMQKSGEENTEDTARVVDIVKILGARLKADCPSTESVDASCEAIRTFKKLAVSAGEREEALAESAAYKQSPAYELDQACYKKIEIGQFKSDINQEKQVGAISGAVNLKRLHDAGRGIVSAEKDLKDIQKKYREKTGKALPQNPCNQ
jgi:hypothetical protein